MWTIAEVKERGKASFKANYWKCVLGAFLLTLFTGGAGAVSNRGGAGSEDFSELQQQFSSLTDGNMLAVALIALLVLAAMALAIGIGIAIKIFLTNPLRVGCLYFFVKNAEAPPVELDTVGLGFKNYWHTFVTLFLTDLYILGSGMDLSEADLWWLLCCKKRHPSNSRTVYITPAKDLDAEKELMLRTYDVEIEKFEEVTDYRSFYEEALQYLKKELGGSNN